MQQPRERQLDELQKMLLEKVEEGGKIIVIGWKGSNHDSNTRRLEACKKVEFRTDPPDKIDSRSHVLFAKFISHARSQAVRKRTANYTSYRLELGEIRTVLEPLLKLLPLLPPTKPQRPAEEEVATVHTHREDAARFDAERTEVLPSKREVDKRVAFARAFSQAVNGDPEGSLSKYATAKLVRDHFGEKVLVSKYRDLLAPVVRPGKKNAGSYKATSELLELATSADRVTEPADPIERARWLISKEQDLVTKLSSLRAEIVAIEKQLNRISETKKLLAQLETLISI